MNHKETLRLVSRTDRGDWQIRQRFPAYGELRPKQLERAREEKYRWSLIEPETEFKLIDEAGKEIR